MWVIWIVLIIIFILVAFFLLLGYYVFFQIYHLKFKNFWDYIYKQPIPNVDIEKLKKIKIEKETISLDNYSIKKVDLYEFSTEGLNNSNKAVIFFHGAQWNHLIAYKHCLNYFSQGYRVFAIDLFGFGESDVARLKKHTFGWTETVYLKEVVSYIKNHKHIVLLGMHGESLGGFYTLRYASLFDQLNLVNWYVAEGFPYSIYKSFLLALKKDFKTPIIFNKFILAGFAFWFFLTFKINFYNICLNKSLKNANNRILLILSETDALIKFKKVTQFMSENKILENKNVQLLTFINARHVLAVIDDNKKFIESLNTFINEK